MVSLVSYLAISYVIKIKTKLEEAKQFLTMFLRIRPIKCNSLSFQKFSLKIVTKIGISFLEKSSLKADEREFLS